MSDFNTLAQYRPSKCDGLFHRTLMAKFFTNTRVSYALRAVDLNIGKPVWAAIDTHVDAFMREILGVELLQDSPAVHAV